MYLCANALHSKILRYATKTVFLIFLLLFQTFSSSEPWFQSKISADVIETAQLIMLDTLENKKVVAAGALSLARFDSWSSQQEGRYRKKLKKTHPERCQRWAPNVGRWQRCQRCQRCQRWMHPSSKSLSYDRAEI